jgi:hypothetical protein
MQELAENYCNLATTDHPNKENNCAIVSAWCQEMSEMKVLILALQQQPQSSPQVPFQNW